MSDSVNSKERVAAGEPPFPSSTVAWYATGILALLYWLSILDRYIISLLVDPIKKDLGISDVQFSVLQGIGFVGSFTLFGLVFGALADRANRRKLIYVGVAIWSVATAACGVALNFFYFLLARIGVGVGEAALNPNATSMIADLFPRSKLTTAMAVYGIGATVGSGTALIVGGAIVAMVSQLDSLTIPLIGAIRPWQTVFLIVGIPGAVIALCIFTVPEPIRRGKRTFDESRSGMMQTYARLLKFMRAQPRFFIYHYLGFIFASAVTTGGVAWYPAHIGRTFGWTPGEVGAALGPAMMIAGIVSKVACGRLVDTMYQRGYRDAQLRWYGFAMLLAAPIGVFATMSSNAWVFIASIAVFMTLIGAFQACAMTALNLVTPNEMRGSGVALFGTIVGLIGASAGPMFVAAAAKLDADASIGVGLAVVIGICCPLGALFLLRGLAPMRAAMALAEDSSAAKA